MSTTTKTYFFVAIERKLMGTIAWNVNHVNSPRPTTNLRQALYDAEKALENPRVLRVALVAGHDQSKIGAESRARHGEFAVGPFADRADVLAEDEALA